MCPNFPLLMLKEIRSAFCGLGLKENMPYMLKTVAIFCGILLVCSSLRLLFAIHYLANFNSVTDRAEEFFDNTSNNMKPGDGRMVFSISSEHLNVLHRKQKSNIPMMRQLAISQKNRIKAPNCILAACILASLAIIGYLVCLVMRQKFAINWNPETEAQLRFIDEEEGEGGKKKRMVEITPNEVCITKIVLFCICILILIQLAIVFFTYLLAGSARIVITENIESAQSAHADIRDLEREWHCKLDCTHEFANNRACAMCARVVRNNVIDLPFFIVATITLILELSIVLFIFPRLNAWLLHRKEKRMREEQSLKRKYSGNHLSKPSTASKSADGSPLPSPSPFQ